MPPAMTARPTALALVEAGGVDLGAIGAGQEEALLVQHVLAAPAHAAFARPDPARRIDHRQPGLLLRLTDSGVGVFLAGIDEAADHYPERVEVRVGRIVDAGIVDVEQ